jgi:Zn-dependent protease with chaperone function
VASDCRPLTDDERARLEPLIEETEIPVCVTAEPTVWFETDEDTRSFAGEAIGWWPVRSREVVIDERCFDRLTDEEFLGLVAHELGHHAGYHGLIGKLYKVCVSLFGLGALVGLWTGAALWARSGEWFLVALGVVGVSCLFALQTVGTGVFRRWMEYDATRRGARLLGRTEPLEALYEPRADEADGSWWAELLYPYPHPRDQLAQLAALSEDLDRDDLDDDR